MSPNMRLRPALADDLDFLAERIYAVSAGVAPLLLDGLLPGVSATDLLGMALNDEHSHYSYKNCILAEVDGAPAGLLFAYDSALQHIPPLVERVIPARRLEPAREILTISVPGSLYVNTLWVSENVRGMGLADVMLDCAAGWAEDLSLRALSLFSWSDNARANAFYARRGFKVVRAVAPTGELLSLHPGGGHVYALNLSASAAKPAISEHFKQEVEA